MGVVPCSFRRRPCRGARERATPAASGADRRLRHGARDSRRGLQRNLWGLATRRVQLGVRHRSAGRAACRYNSALATARRCRAAAAGITSLDSCATLGQACLQSYSIASCRRQAGPIDFLRTSRPWSYFRVTTHRRSEVTASIGAGTAGRPWSWLTLSCRVVGDVACPERPPARADGALEAGAGSSA